MAMTAPALWLLLLSLVAASVYSNGDAVPCLHGLLRLDDGSSGLAPVWHCGPKGAESNGYLAFSKQLVTQFSARLGPA